MRVNRYLKDKAMDRMDHALGCPVDPMQETFRNYYVVGDDNPTEIPLLLADAEAFWPDGIERWHPPVTEDEEGAA